MEREIKQITSCEHELTITVPAEEAMQEYRKMLGQFRKYAVVPGFRKGKAPLAMVENLYGERAKEEFVNEKLKDFYVEALKEEDLHPVTEAEPLKWEWEKDKPFVATYRYEVKPELGELKYQDLEIEFDAREVTEEQVEETVEKTRREVGNIEPVEGPVGENSFVDVEIYINPNIQDAEEGEPSDEEIKPVSRELEVGKNPFSKALNDQLIGMKAGDEGEAELFDKREEEMDEVRAHYSENKFRFVVKQVKQLVLPELNDEFAKDADFESMDAMRESIRSELQKQADHENRQGEEEAIITALIKANEFDVPKHFVENYAYQMSESMAKQYNMPVEQIAPAYIPVAERNVREYYIVDKLKQMLEIDVTDDDKAAMIDELAVSMNLKPEEYRERYQKQIDSDDFRDAIVRKKIMQKVKEGSKIVPVPKKEENAEATEETKE